MNYRPATMLGRLSSGLEADHGTRVHAVARKPVKPCPAPINAWGKNAELMARKVMAEGALCGARPGRRPVGWSTTETAPVSCPRCLAKLARRCGKPSLEASR